MVKSKFLSPQQYVSMLGQIIQNTEDAGEKVSPYFEKLRTAINADQVNEMPKSEFQEISAEFDDVVEIYMAAAKEIKNLKVPVRFLGAHTGLTKTFAAYADATDMMAKSLDVTAQTVNMTDFEQSEKDQDELMGKFLGQVRRILSTGV